MNSNSNATTGSSADGCASTTAINVDGHASSRKRPPKGKRDEYQKTPKAAVTKYAKGKIPPKLTMVKEIVECQPTNRGVHYRFELFLRQAKNSKKGRYNLSQYRKEISKVWNFFLGLKNIFTLLYTTSDYYMYLPLCYHVDVFILQARRPKRRVFWLTCK